MGTSSHRRFARTLLLVTCVLAACADAPAPAGPQPWTEISSPALGVRFTHPVALQSVAVDMQARGEQWKMPTGFAYGIVLSEHRSQGIGDWALPEGFSEQFTQDPSCERLANPDVYLPINASYSMACDILKKPDGTYVIYLVGAGRPYEDFVFRESLLLWLRGTEAVVLQGIAPLTAFSPAEEALLDSHPQALYGSEEFTNVSAELDAMLEADFRIPSPEVAEALRVMWKMGESIEKINN